LADDLINMQNSSVQPNKKEDTVAAQELASMMVVMNTNKEETV